MDTIVTHVDYAIIRDILSAKMDTLYGIYPYTILPSNRVYTCPYHSEVEVGSAANDVHIYGDAVDMHSDSTTWQGLHDAAQNLDVRPCVEPQSQSTTNHVHMDFRTVSTSFYYRSSCPSGW